MEKKPEANEASPNVVSLKERQAKPASLTLGDLHPLLAGLVSTCGMDFVCDLQKACQWAKRDVQRRQIKPGTMCVVPFKHCYLRPDATTVAFLEPTTGQLLFRSTVHSSGCSYYDLASNSDALILGGGKEMIRFLLGGLFVCDEGLANKWEHLLTKGY